MKPTNLSRSASLCAVVIVVISFGKLGCASTTPNGAALSDHKGRTGGTLPAFMPERTVVVEADAVLAWGLVEVPSSARLSAAQAMAEAAARAELSRFIGVRVTSFMRSEHRVDASQDILMVTETAAHSVLSFEATPEIGWSTNEDRLTVIARVRMPLATFERALAEQTDAQLARRIVAGLKP
ncbi:MAG: hypothetical protein AAF449_15395 [Myxococcota bacterium]